MSYFFETIANKLWNAYIDYREVYLVIKINSKIPTDDPFKTPEWLLTNGLGGYSYLTADLSHNKTYHTLLTGALKPPVERYSVLYDVIGHCMIDQDFYKFNDALAYVLIGDVITYVYKINDITILQTISLVYEKNTLVMNYHITNPHNQHIDLFLEPVLALRDPDKSNEKVPEYGLFPFKGNVSIVPLNHKDVLVHMKSNQGIFTKEVKEYTPKAYSFHEKMGGGIHDHLSIPGYFEAIITDQKYDLSFTCTLEDETYDPIKEIGKEIIRKHNLTFSKDGTFNRLVKASDQFIVKRGKHKSIIAGYPWFNDWGRDSLISLEGLTLVTRRYDDAKDILTTFLSTIHNGLCVNAFRDHGDALYNTADASLWLIHSIYMYYLYTKDLDFIKKYFDTLRSIIFTYVKGTDHDIYLDDNFLLHAGSGEDQITWMDVHIDGKAVTPRHGSPIELNALWYNALCIMDQFAKRLHEESFFDMLASKCKESFNKYFDTHKGYFLDVGYDDDTLRPNQLYTLSLPFSILDEKQGEEMLKIITEKLYVGRGLRTLPEDDPHYHGIYEGEMKVRDEAYHQGTSWAYLIGPYLRADYRIYHNKVRTLALLEPLLSTLDEQCINGINEIFDGDSPHTGKGCVTQAWSIAEVLCIYSLIKNGASNFKDTYGS
jgi:predicted glycogen debranching enzyme